MHRSKQQSFKSANKAEAENQLPTESDRKLNEAINVDPLLDIDFEALPDEITPDNTEQVKEQLKRMRKIMEQRQNINLNSNWQNCRDRFPIDQSFLSFVFGAVLIIILSVSTYAFYNLFSAIIKRHTRYHEEL